MGNHCKVMGLRHAEAVLACLDLLWDEDVDVPFVQPCAINVKQCGLRFSNVTEDRHAWVVNHGSSDDIVLYLQCRGEYIIHYHPSNLPPMPETRLRETVFYCRPDRVSDAAKAVHDYLTKGIFTLASQVI